MTNADLAAMLNADLALTGRSAVTIDVVRQWVAWGVLPKAKATASTIGTSPEWQRDRAAYRLATRLALARASGVHRQTAVIVQAWLEGHYRDHAKAHAALLSEYIRARNRVTKSIVTEMDFADFSRVGEVRKRAMRKQLGPLDDRFKGTRFEASPEFFALAIQSGQIGITDPDRFEFVLRQTINAIGPEFAKISDQFPITPFVGSFTGMFGDPVEIANSAQKTIGSASHRQLRIARYLLRKGLKRIETADKFADDTGSMETYRPIFSMIASLKHQISFGPWPIFMFVQMLQLVKSGGEIAFD